MLPRPGVGVGMIGAEQQRVVRRTAETVFVRGMCRTMLDPPAPGLGWSVCIYRINKRPPLTTTIYREFI